MPKFTVHFTTTASSSATVEAENYDAAIESAMAELPANVCAQCAGWGGSVGIDLGGEWEPESVYDADGKQVWSETA